jgi:hypothetical protein
MEHVECPTGLISESDSDSSCSLVSAGSEYTDSSSESTCASDGSEYSAVGDDTCQTCPLGYECTDVNSANIANCVEGQYSDAGVCTDCPEG